MDEERIRHMVMCEIRNHLSISVKEMSKSYDPAFYIEVELKYKDKVISSDYVEVPSRG